MKKGNQSIALVLLGIVAIVAVIGLVLLMARMSGAVVDPRTYKSPIVQTETFNWDKLVGFTDTEENAAWCAATAYANGGWSESLQGQPQMCYAITPTYVPQDLFMMYNQAAAGEGYAVGCFTEAPRAAPKVCLGR